MRALHEGAQDCGADPPAQRPVRDGQSAHLTEVLPEHVQRAATDQAGGVLGDDEVLDRLVVADGLLGEQHAALGEGRHEGADAAHIGGAGGADGHIGDVVRHGARLGPDRVDNSGRPASAGMEAGR